MKIKKPNRPAMAGQIAVEVACGCEGTTLVLRSAVPTWTCGRCRHKPKPTGREVELGDNGALPVGWRDEIVEAVAS